ncbi:ATPase domain-containing protein [Palleronia pelagia]|uniref:ATPase domain-containing protein n=1 Tax=Palleronia pelagia TaxID=387096 RepID=UPI0022A8D4E9|nr:ATPase domain-containing protein [Palleronia pelagia]
MVTYPRVLPQLSKETLSDELISCGIGELDHMLGGGLQPGTTCLIVGQSGTGKSTLATAYAQAAAGTGRKTAMFLFEERPEIFRRRSEDLGFRISHFEANGTLKLKHYHPAEVPPGQFARAVVSAVEDDGARIVVIDSLTGYLGALPEGRRLITQLHALLSYLSRRDVLTILTMIRPGLLTGDSHSIRADTSYLADSAILLRHEEVDSALRRTITVLKKRHGDHEHSIREFRIGGTSVTVGEGDADETRASPKLGVV